MHNYSVLNSLTANDKKDIDSFLYQKKEFNYFQSPSFFYVCNASKKLTASYIVARNDNEIIGVLLVCRQAQFTAPILSFLTSRSLIIGGPVVKLNDHELIGNLINIYKKQVPSVIYTQIRNVDDTSAYKEIVERHNFIYEDHLNSIINLTNSEETLWKNIDSKRRNEIRRAQKEGCTVETQESLDALRCCYAILKEVYQRAKLPLPGFSHFKALLQFSTERDGLRMFTALWNGKIIGCMLCLAHNNTLYDYYAGSYREYYSKYPNDLLPWEVFKWGQQHGFEYFDFGGAGKPGVHYGVRDYKKNLAARSLIMAAMSTPNFQFCINYLLSLLKFISL